MRNRPANSNLEPNVVVAPQQLAMMAQVMEAYCVAFALEDPARREKLGRLLQQCLEEGARTTDELADALDQHIGRGCLR